MAMTYMEPPNGAPDDWRTLYWETGFKNLFSETGWQIESYSTAVRIEFFAPRYANKYYAIMWYDYAHNIWKYEIISDQVKAAYKSFADFVAVLRAMANAKKIDKLNAINTADGYVSYLTETFCDRGWDITKMNEHRIIINFFPKEANKSYGRIYYDNDAWRFTVYGEPIERPTTFAAFIAILQSM
jgi:hypothetical protein